MKLDLYVIEWRYAHKKKWVRTGVKHWNKDALAAQLEAFLYSLAYIQGYQRKDFQGQVVPMDNMNCLTKEPMDGLESA